jgi:hypothetical protein
MTDVTERKRFEEEIFARLEIGGIGRSGKVQLPVGCQP